MKLLPLTCLIVFCSVLTVAAPAFAAAPVVSNVVATPLALGRVKITYNLADPDTASLYVTLAVSNNGGTSYNTVPSATALSGAVGPGVARGTGKQIIWTSCLTFPGATGGSYKVKVTADDSTGSYWGGGGGGTVGDMVYIPSGSFLMGNSGVGNDAVYGYWDEHPQHSVYLSAYWIGKYEVTRGEYRAFMTATGRAAPQYWADYQDWTSPYGDENGFTQTENHPVLGVTYYDAEAYCAWAGGHLPTEAQWEKAARWDGHPRVYPWGDAWDAKKCNNYDDTSVGRYRTAPVGSYPSGASPYGCQDMAGNVWEWCKDWYTSYPGSSSPFDYTNSYRVLRGGCWVDSSSYYRAAYRYYDNPNGASYGAGFRLAR